MRHLVVHERVRGDGVLQPLAPGPLEAANLEGDLPKHVAEGVLVWSPRRRRWGVPLERTVVRDYEVKVR